MKKPKNTTFRMTEEEYHMHDDSHDGGCLACGEIQDGGCEPDARNYKCEACGERQVFGMQELMIVGHIELIEESEGGE